MKTRSGSLPAPLLSALTASRRTRGLSQAELGKIVGLPQMHISGIETGKVVPRYDTLLDLVRVLGHDLILVPRELVPIVEALIRDRNAGPGERPLYLPDPDEDDEDEEDGAASA
jgi:transcriptional regulator with XRE-family HTH domain